MSEPWEGERRKFDWRYMMATQAFHKLGDISSGEADLCRVSSEEDEYFYGSWVCGLGFIDVAFPKATTRRLVPEEVQKYDGMGLTLSGAPIGRLDLAGRV